MTKNSCLGCSLFTRCFDPKKKASYSCKKFSPLRKKLSRAEAETIYGSLTVQLHQEDTTANLLDNPDADFDIVSLVESAYDADTNTVRDLKVDDRDLPKAKNFYDYCLHYLGPTAKVPFARQMWMGYKLLAEYCPRCSNPKWENVYEVPVDYNARNMPEHVQFLENGVCPKCKWTKSKLIRAGLMNLYSELDVCAGQRSGKSAYTAALSTYITHLHLKNPRLATLCDGIQESTPLTATFVGIRFDDAYKLLWTPILEIMDASPWFNEYHALLNQCSEKYGKELLKKRDVYVRYAHKNIDLFPMSSNKRALRGRTRFLGAVDEIGWFPLNPNAKADEDAGDGNSDRERADGEEVYTSLDRSMLTVRAEVHRLIHVKGISTIPTAINVLISSPASAKDKISRLVEQNKHSKSALAVHLPTWEMNPNLPEDHPIIRKAYHDNPSRAERDYGAKPPKSINPYMANPDIKANFKGMNRATAKIVDKNMHGTHYRGGMLNKVMPENDIPPAILSVDAGYCVSGDTLIPTDYGLLRIDTIGDFADNAPIGSSRRIRLLVGTQSEPEVAKRVIFSGVKPLVKVLTKEGHQVKVTKDHQILVSRGLDLVWVKAKHLSLGDVLCTNLSQPVSCRPFPLTLSDPTPDNKKRASFGIYKWSKNTWVVRIPFRSGAKIIGKYSSCEEARAARDARLASLRFKPLATNTQKVKKPKVMTPDLAFILGALISEGTFDSYHVGVSNTNLVYLDKFSEAVRKVFGVHTKGYGGTNLVGKKLLINGVVGKSNKKCYTRVLHSVTVSAWLTELGLVPNQGRKTSYVKDIPECILRADRESKRAFLAAYIEGDGSIRPSRRTIIVWSKSPLILRKLQLLFHTLGVPTKINKDHVFTSTSVGAEDLYREIRPYLTHKMTDMYGTLTTKSGRTQGIPSQALTKLIKGRLVSREKHRYGKVTTTYVSDTGALVTLGKLPHIPEVLLYDVFSKGKYDELLRQLAIVSPSTVDKIVRLMDLRYQFSPVVSLEKSPKEKVYDLEVTERNPSFIANGLVVHNSNNSFGLTLMYKEALKIVVPVLIEIQPSQGAVLHYNAIWKGVIVPLIQQFNVQLLLADRWQSLALLHRAQDELGIKAAVYSVKRRDFDLVKSKFESQEFVLPSIEAVISDDVAIMDYPSAFTGKPAAHLFFQCMTVRDMGKTVVKGDGYTDDLFRALVLGASRAFDPKVIEYLATRRKTKRGPVALGSMIGLTSGGMTSTSRAISAARAIPRIASVGMLSRR